MTDIKNWSTTAGSNTSVGGVSIAEGMAPSAVNNAMRASNAAVRSWYEDADWVDLGHTPTRTADATLSIPTDLTATYHVNRRIRFTDGTTKYGTISVSAYSAPNTNLTVTMDSGTLTASLSAVAIGSTKTNDAEPRGIFEVIDADILRADTTDTLVAGYTVASSNQGTKSSGTFTPDPANANMQYAINGGAHSVAPPANDCTMVVKYQNNSSAGAYTFAGWTLVDGDATTTTNGHQFFLYITRLNGVTHLTVKAMQ